MWEEMTPMGKITQYPEKPELYTRTAPSRMFNPKHMYFVGYWRTDRKFAVVESAGNWKSARHAQGVLNTENTKAGHHRRYSVIYAK